MKESSLLIKNISVYYAPGGQSLLPVLHQGGQGVPLIVLEPQAGRCLQSHRGQGLPSDHTGTSGGPVSETSGGPGCTSDRSGTWNLVLEPEKIISKKMLCFFLFQHNIKEGQI